MSIPTSTLGRHLSIGKLDGAYRAAPFVLAQGTQEILAVLCGPFNQDDPKHIRTVAYEPTEVMIPALYSSTRTKTIAQTRTLLHSLIPATMLLWSGNMSPAPQAPFHIWLSMNPAWHKVVPSMYKRLVQR